MTSPYNHSWSGFPSGMTGVPTPLEDAQELWKLIAERIGHNVDKGVQQRAPIIGGRRRLQRPITSWHLSNDRTLTLTTDELEAKTWNNLKDKRHPSMPRIYDTFSVKRKDEPGAKLWAIVHEKLTWPVEKDWDLFVDSFFKWRAMEREALSPAKATDLEGFLRWVIDPEKADPSTTQKNRIEVVLPWKMTRQRRDDVADRRKSLFALPDLEEKISWAKSALQYLKKNKVKFRDFDPSNLAMTVQGNRAVITNLAESRSIPTKTGRTGRVKGSADVSQKLEELVGKDQNLRSKFADMIEKRGGWEKLTPDERSSLVEEFIAVNNTKKDDVFDSKKVEQEFLQLEPDLAFDEFSEDDWSNFWLLSQHMDSEPAFQKRALKAIEQHRGKNSEEYKSLLFRIGSNEGAIKSYDNIVDLENLDALGIDWEGVSQKVLALRAAADSILVARKTDEQSMEKAIKFYSIIQEAMKHPDIESVVQVTPRKGIRLPLRAVTDDPELRSLTLVVHQGPDTFFRDKGLEIVLATPPWTFSATEPKKSFVRAVSSAMVKNPLVHELVHFVDFLRIKGWDKAVSNYPAPDKDFAKYANHPVEMNAYFQQSIADFVKDYKSVTEKIEDDTGPDNDGSSDHQTAVWRLMDTAYEKLPHFMERWQAQFKPNIWKALSPENQKKMKSRAYQLFDRINSDAKKRLKVLVDRGDPMSVL